MILTLAIRNVDRLEGDLPTTLTLDGQGAVIGRSAACDWRLPDPANRISGRHCEILFREGAYVLKDISTNGTYLWRAPDRLAGEHVIADGEVFEIGHYEVAATLGQAEAMPEKTALWLEGGPPPVAAEGPPAPRADAPEPPVPADRPAEEPPSWPVFGQAPAQDAPPAADPDPIEPAAPSPPAEPPAPEPSSWGMSRGPAAGGAGWDMPAPDLSPDSPSDAPDAAQDAPADAPAPEPTSWGMSLPGRQAAPPADWDTPAPPAADPAGEEAPRREAQAWGVSLRTGDASGGDGWDEPPAEPVAPEPPASEAPLQPDSPAPVEPPQDEPAAFEPQTPPEPQAADSWDSIPVPETPEPPPFEIQLRPPTLFQPQSLDEDPAPVPAPEEPAAVEEEPQEDAAPPVPAAAGPVEPASFEGQLREPTSLYVAQAAGEAGSLPLVDGRYRLDGEPVAGPLFEDVRAVDTWLDRLVLLRRVRTGASPTARTTAGAYFARWRQFARHRIVGMPPIVAVTDAHVVLDVADTMPLDQLLQSDGVRNFRAWLLDRALCEGLRALADVHALGLVHGDVRAANLLVSPVNGAVYLANPVPEGATDEPYMAAADIAALGRALEDAAWQVGLTPRAVIGWMTAPEGSRPTAVELLETVGLGMQAMKPAFAPADPAPPPADPVRMPVDWTPPPYGADPAD